MINRLYQRHFPSAPVSYFVSFAILHEITAIVPIPILYFALSTAEFVPSIDPEYVEYGTRLASKYFKHETGEIDMRIIYLASAYGITKLMMPWRLAASVMMTPWFARRIVDPVRLKLKYR